MTSASGPPAKVVIGLDVGTTATKAVAFSLGTPWRYVAAREYPLLEPRPGWQVQDPEIMLAAVSITLADCAAAIGTSEVVALSVSTAMHGLIGLDAAMQPVTPLLTWADARSREEARELRDSGRAAALHRASGTPVHPMTPLTKLMWFSRHAPETCAAVRWWAGLKDYVIWRLTGTLVTELSNLTLHWSRCMPAPGRQCHPLWRRSGPSRTYSAARPDTANGPARPVRRRSSVRPVSPALDCRVERGPVVIRIGSAALPPATVQPELPGCEYVRLFDVVHAAVLHWSPNVMAATAGAIRGLSGDADDRPLEDAIDALTYSFVAYQSQLVTPTEIDPQVLRAVTALAAKGSGAPDSTDAWTACLRESVELHNAVRTQPVSRLTVDLEAGSVRVSG